MAQKGYIKNSLTKDLGAPEMANMFQGILGASGIMSLYENLACVKVNNNTVRMSSGAYNLSGHLLGIAKGTTEDLTIDSGTSGQNRNDLIVAEFVRNGGGLGVDTLHFRVVKGTSTSGTAADPALTQQDINAAGVTRQEALYRVKVVGTEITAVEKIAGSVSNLNLVESAKANKTSESFKTATLENSWTGTLKYKKTDTGVVVLTGSVTSGTLTWGTTIATLPAGYRPLESVVVPFLRVSDNRTHLAIVIDTNGGVRWRNDALPPLTASFHVAFIAS